LYLHIGSFVKPVSQFISLEKTLQHPEDPPSSLGDGVELQLDEDHVLNIVSRSLVIALFKAGITVPKTPDDELLEVD
jgi:hypothetical protein